MKERQQRFGIETKETLEAKREERRKRFSNEPDFEASEAKRSARLERFGKEAFDEVADRKRDRKRFGKPNHKGNKAGGHKRFRKH